MMKRLTFLFVIGITFMGCSDDEAPQLTLEEYFVTQNITNVTKTSSGLYYVIDDQGTGNTPHSGSTVSVYYTGYHLDGSVFDSNTEGDGFSFRLGAGQVIKGWDEGIALVNLGGSATLYIPTELAYGSQGAGSSIAPNEALKFSVELLGIN